MPEYSIEIDKTMEHLVSRWKDADKLNLRKLFPLLAEGRPISAIEFSNIIGKDINTTENILKGGRTDRDNQGRVIELYGVMLIPTPHRIMVDDVALFSCCAMVSQMVPLLLRKNAIIESLDPIDNRVIKIIISERQIASVEPKDAVTTFVVTNHKEVIENIRTSFCNHVQLFSKKENAEEFVRMESRRYIISIDELFRIAKQLQENIWG
jgi:hypothetical protein